MKGTGINRVPIMGSISTVGWIDMPLSLPEELGSPMHPCVPDTMRVRVMKAADDESPIVATMSFQRKRIRLLQKRTIFLHLERFSSDKYLLVNR